MSKSKLSNIATDNGQDPEPQKLKEKEERLCWHCKKDTSKLIRPCKCANKFIHIQCLEIVTNTEKIRDCRTCETRYPLVIQRQSLLEMNLKIRILIFFCIAFVMLFGMLLICIPLWVISKNMSDDQYLHLEQSMVYLVQLIKDPYILLVIIININVFGLNYILAAYVIDWGKRIYELYDEWHRSTYEWKLIEGYNVNIQDIKETTA